MIREFVCKECHHTVVVDPRLPPDYVPNICKQCWNSSYKAKSDAQIGKILQGVFELCELLDK